MKTKPKVTRILILLSIILILTSSTLPILSIKPVFAASIFQDGFESGSFSAWSVKNGGNVTSGDAFHGTYKAVLNVTGEYDQAKFTNIADCFMRAYVMFKSFPSAGSDTPIFGVYNTSGVYMAEARVAVNASGTAKWELRYYNSTTHYTAVSAQQLPVLNTWYCVEAEGKANSATNAEARMYVNGQELTDITQTGKNNPNLINCGYIWVSFSTGSVVIWYDDVAIDSAYIGPETATLAVNPPTSNVTLGTNFNIDINITNVVGLTAWQFSLYYPNNLLSCNNVTEGPFLKAGGGTFFNETITNDYDSTHGRLLAFCTLLGSTSASGGGVLATVNFTALADGDAILHLNETKLCDTAIPPQPIDHVDIDGTVHVQSFTLAVTIEGGGSVILNNTGPYYHYGEAVKLTAVPAIGWGFGHWSQDLTGSSSPTTLLIARDMSVTANFTEDQYSLTITIVGHGSVGKSPDSATYTWGTNVTLTASADVGWTFAGWSVDASGTVSPTTVNVTGNKAVTATFTENVYTLTITPDGSGSVTTNQSAPYHYGDVVQLTATPDLGWSFQYWMGDLSGSANVTTITMTADHSVTAHFINRPTLQMSATSKTCRIYHENFTVAIIVSSAANFKDFTFEVDYNTTLLDYVSVTWGIWGSGSASITVDEPNGKITISNSGTPVSGTQTLVTIKFTASMYHIFKFGTGWTNDLIDKIYFQSISISYPAGPDLHYQRGDSTQISVGPDFAYKFSPIQGDVDNNGLVDIFDIRTVAAYFDTKTPAYDLDMDGLITVADIEIVANNFNFTYVP